MKAIGACLWGGLLVLTWVAVTGSAGCTTGNSNQSRTADIGESCVTKGCRAPARCQDVSDKSVGGRACFIPCGSHAPSSRSACPRGMVCAIPTFSTTNICIKERHGPFH